MKTEAADVIVPGFLKGAFDVLDAMLAREYQTQIGEVREVEQSALPELLTNYPAVMQAKVEGGGAVALLLSITDAAIFAALVEEREPAEKNALEDSELDTLREVAEPALGGGVSNLMERFGRDVAQLEDVAMYVAEANADRLAGALGGAIAMASFQFDAGGGHPANAVFLYDYETFEAMCPEELLDAQHLATDPSLSPEEMSDILSGFGPEDAGQEAGAAPSGGGEGKKAPDNLDMVLDIQLEAVARLGSVEMPIGRIMGLGPGSIVEVGHLVDEPVELLVNNKLIARGDVVVVDEKFGLRITEIVTQRERIESMR